MDSSVAVYLANIFHNILLFIRFNIICKKMDPAVLRCKEEKRGILFLVNHTSNIDASIVENYLVTHCGILPTIWIIDFAMKLPYISYCLKAIPMRRVPYVLRNPHADNAKEVDALVDETVHGLKHGQHYLIFPSGASKTSPYELIWGKSAVERILKQFPDVPICLVTIKGMWGSRFSKAAKREAQWTHENKRWYGIFWQWAKIILFNMLFFVPKRKVKISFKMAPATFPRRGSRREINRFLENYYNSKWGAFGELLYLVPEYSWSSYCRPVELLEQHWHYQQQPLTASMKQEWLRKLNEIAPEPVADISPLSHLGRDLGMDSLEIVEFCRWLEGRYGVLFDDLSNMQTVGVLAAFVQKQQLQLVTKTVALRTIFQSAPLRETLTPVRKLAWRASNLIPFCKPLAD